MIPFALLSRAAFASYFLAEGYRAFVRPKEHLDEGSELLIGVAAKVADEVPDAMKDLVPQDQESITKSMGAAELALGVAYTLGVAPRVAAAALAGLTATQTAASFSSMRVKDLVNGDKMKENLARLSVFGACVAASVGGAKGSLLGSILGATSSKPASA
jgi:uncharacterized membrane protein YphA (DoxX/SURF4 family)